MSTDSERLEPVLAPFRRIGAYISIRQDAAGAPFVHGIQCGGRDATDEHVELLSQFQQLHAVGFENTGITNASMPFFARLNRLESLDLNGTEIDDDGLAQLQAMRWLEFLHVEHTKVTEHGVRDLSRYLPNCEIISDWT